ncbi:MAG: hypothetical protein M3328_08565, partial [Chloroflexota bacterium]|nr:hypothetical protein [Chloroflexota bacterium]
MLKQRGRYQDWLDWLKRVPVTPLAASLLVSLPLTALAIYYLPYPASTPWLFAWLVLLSLGMLVLSTRWSLEQSTYRYLNALLITACVVVVNTTISMGAIPFKLWSFQTPYSSLHLLIVSSILLGMFILLQGRENTAAYRTLTRPIGIALHIVLYIGLVFLLDRVVPNRFREAEEKARHGPAVPWQVQLSVAQENAFRRNKYAVLEHVTASTIFAREQDYNTALNTRFYFVTPSGERFKVVLNDTNPQESLSLEDVNDLDPLYGGRTLSHQELQTLRSVIPTIKLSPRDALQRTGPEILPVAREHGETWTDPWIELRIA